jgi:hypothetical protein
MPQPKLKTQKRHAKIRALERYAIGLTNQGLDQAVKMIQKGKATFIERQSLRVTVWEMDIDGKRVRVVYDKLRKNLATFLPPSTVSTLSVPAVSGVKLLPKDDAAEIIKVVQANGAVLVERISNRVSIWDVPRGGKTVRVHYDRKHKTIAIEEAVRRT